LEAGPKGTEVIQRIFAQAGDRLAAGGWLLVEISPTIETAVRALFSGSYWELRPTRKDLAGRARVIEARKK
jgi:methylase of polypeptide subunit release factors